MYKLRMSLLSQLQVNFLAADVASCTSLRSNSMTADTLTLTKPLVFPGGGVRVGTNAGLVNQGTNAVAIGTNAAPLNQAAHSIVINATGAALNALVPDSLYIAPIRQADGTNVVFYDTATKEVTHATGGVSQVVSIQDNVAVTHNMTFVAGVLTAYSTT